MSALDLASEPKLDRAFILGIGVSAVTLDRAVSTIERWIERRTPNYVCITGAHGVIESRDDPKLRRIHNEAGMVTPDGMPLVFMARRLGFKPVSRVYGPDLMRRLTELSARKGYRQYYYGGGPGLAEHLAATLRARYPTLSVAGTMTPPFRPLTVEEDEAVVASINAAKPDIVWVGLSTPKQEFWMASHLGRLNAPVLVGVGAAFDFLAGTKSQAPAWMQRSGLEWSYRLVHEPRRLWKRYARIVPLFLVLALAQIIAHRMGGSSPIEAGR
jgi:N-acetylglucosaminyldiphosphoundecaprenol N-acetyl-beta-D-mannosaminyltransferase